MAEAVALAEQDMGAAVAAGGGSETLVLVQARRDLAAGAAAGDVNTVAAYLAVRDVCVSCRIGAVWAAGWSARRRGLAQVLLLAAVGDA